MTCEATRKALKLYGWVCNGEDLTIVVEASGSLPPAVIRRDLLPQLFTDPVYRMFRHTARPFLTGGDHLHLILPKRSAWRLFLLKMGIGS
jgi:hypothetical protein